MRLQPASSGIKKKLDGEGLIDNRLFPDKLYHFVQKNGIKKK